VKHAFTGLFHVTNKILFLFTELVATVSIYSVFVITVLKLRNDKAIATDREALSQKTNLIELFETILANTFHEDGVIHKVKGSYTGNANLGSICQNYRFLAPLKLCT
jgi:hypothetical protein